MKLSLRQRAADRVTEFCGSWTFIAIGSLLTAGWVLWNRGDKTFDPYPYILFNLVLTVVSTFQSPLIMMSQNRQIERDREIVQGLHAKLDKLLARQVALKYSVKIELHWVRPHPSGDVTFPTTHSSRPATEADFRYATGEQSL